MEPSSSRAGSPTPTPTLTPTPTALQPASQDRVNQRRDSNALFSSVRTSDARDSCSVHDKIHQFNSLAMQSKQLERKTADAALKRAMLGREEAEAEMRRYRDEARLLRKQVEEGRERERKVGERLETVMVRNMHTAHHPLLAGAWYARETWRRLTLFAIVGELRPRKGNTRTYSGPVGEGDPPRAQGDVQVTERHRQATRRTQVRTVGTEVCRGDARARKGAQQGARARGVLGQIRSGRGAAAAR